MNGVAGGDGGDDEGFVGWHVVTKGAVYPTKEEHDFRVV